MYSYEWDAETGGILLNSTPLQMSKEPRPVYYKELDILGFDKYWKYDKDDKYPYMWAEANNYFYKGRLVAKIKGGTMCTAPEIVILDNPEPNDEKLKFVDVKKMVEKNKTILDQFSQLTIKKTYETFLKYRKKVDIYYVAFSGGKDSIVTFDIVRRALPHNEFKVLFGNTGMEFPDTYKLVDQIEKICNEEDIDLIRASSHLKPLETWRQFGPPATVTRWCCSVHKTAPQILKIRDIIGKSNFTGMAFVGVRASESVSRSEYDYIGIGEKHKGQLSCNPILDWNSAELYLYIYYRDLPINECYKKGNSRAGCLVCPMVSEKNSFFRRICYKDDYDKFIDIIKDLYKDKLYNEDRLNEFIENTGWKARMNGRDINIPIGCKDEILAKQQVLHISNPKTDWKEWIKTIGVLLNDRSPYEVSYGGKIYSFEIIETKNGYDVIISNDLSKKNAVFVKFLKNVFHRAACCIGCKECAADCHNGYINIENGKVRISDDCYHCTQCHKVDRGCLIYKSLELPKGDFKMKTKSLNCYSTHAPLIEWFEDFFDKKEEFFISPSINGPKVEFFTTFLKHANLLENGKLSKTAKIIDSYGLEDEISWALMLANLAYTPEVNWYIKNVEFNEVLNKQYIISKLLEDENCTNERAASDIFRAYSRLMDLKFNCVGMGELRKDNKKISELFRTPWYNPEPRVILYSLYKFAEKCDNYYQFSLTRLLNHNIASDGISPTEIFGLDRVTMERVLQGLAINYPDFISVSFTHDLDNINLKNDKTSDDVLELF